MPASEIANIPGLSEILQKYKEFHAAAKELLGNRTIANDQPQRFTFDDRMEPRRVRDYILRHYTGDITETMQQALRYYYVNKLESPQDRAKLETIITLVETGGGKTRGRGLERERSSEHPPEYPAPYISEAKAIATLEQYLAAGVGKADIARGLSGLDSEQAWDMRKKFIEAGVDKDYIAYGLAGLDSEKAWDMREELLAAGVGKAYIALGLAGLDSEQAWDMREEFYRRRGR